MDSSDDDATIQVTGNRLLKSTQRNIFRAHGMEMNRRDRERLVHLASLLPQTQRLLMVAYLENNLTVRELAALHRTTPRRMRRRLEGLRETLADPCFLAAAQSAAQLPAELASLARARWLEGRPLRELAILRRQTLHSIRQQLATARVLLQNVQGDVAPRSAARLSVEDEASQ